MNGQSSNQLNPNYDPNQHNDPLVHHNSKHIKLERPHTSPHPYHQPEDHFFDPAFEEHAQQLRAIQHLSTAQHFPHHASGNVSLVFQTSMQPFGQTIIGQPQMNGYGGPQIPMPLYPMRPQRYPGPGPSGIVPTMPKILDRASLKPIPGRQVHEDGTLTMDLSTIPTVTQFESIIHNYIGSLSPKKRDKALISQKRYNNIMAVLKDPKCTTIESAQFRFWAKKMFKLSTLEGQPVVLHERKPVGVREGLYEILITAHMHCRHGGRDKTSGEVRKFWSWVPKELIARFVRDCPTCSVRRVTEGQKEQHTAEPSSPPSASSSPASAGPYTPESQDPIDGSPGAARVPATAAATEVEMDTAGPVLVLPFSGSHEQSQAIVSNFQSPTQQPDSPASHSSTQANVFYTNDVGVDPRLSPPQNDGKIAGHNFAGDHYGHTGGTVAMPDSAFNPHDTFNW